MPVKPISNGFSKTVFSLKIHVCEIFNCVFDDVGALNVAYKYYLTGL